MLSFLSMAVSDTGWRSAMSVAAALVGSIAAEHLSGHPLEIWSDSVCWAALSAAFNYKTRPLRPTNHDRLPGSELWSQSTEWRRSVTLWLAAVCISSVTVYRSELGAVPLLPAATPILLVVERLLECDALNYNTNRRIWAHINGIVGTLSIAVLSTGSLVDWNFGNTAPALGPVAALVIAFVIFTPRPDASTLPFRFCRIFSPFVPSLTIDEVAPSLAWRVLVAMLCIAVGDVYLFGPVVVDVVPTFILGLSRALFWYFTIQTLRPATTYDKLSLSSSIPLGRPPPPSLPTQPPSWRIATTILAFGLLSASDPFAQQTSSNALAIAVASLLTLTQIILLLPDNTQWTRVVWTVFAMVPVAPFVANMAALYGFYPAPPHSLLHHEHPVAALVRHGQARFDDLLRRQSMNATAAGDEYRRRYGIAPPPGFDTWFQLARELDTPIIDEYNMIHQSLQPLRVLSGKEIQTAMQTVYTLPDSDVWRCNYVAKTRQTTCTHPTRSFDRNVQGMFNAWLGGGSFGGGVPTTTAHLDVDVTFLVNHLDEPRVLLPAGVDNTGRDKYSVTILDGQPVYDVLTQNCAAQQHQLSQNTASETGPVVDTYGLPFVTDTRTARDLCRHPEYKDMHGMLTSPVSFPLIQGLVPILSCGALSTMGDILYPSPAYSESGFVYDAAHDVPWDKKKNALYWAGSTTGAYAEDGKSGNWRGFHRQRAVAVAQNLEHRQHAYLTDQGGSGNGPVRRVWSSFLNGRLFRVAFTRIFQCDHRACRAERGFFRLQPWAGRDDALASRLVLGVDGNGISGRYYKLVASGSTPLKQTLLREWHDERLVPWVHYVPVSQALDELPELVSYLASAQGEAVARTVAENGQRWFQQAMRPADRAVYVHRLLLELARLQDPERPAGQAETGTSV
ncbi:hypothetical protein SPBR_01322 [Sporothrix brasiliensis 5110]|uniref:Glycosyl transferase CAP10 domain-containing protein n=1 Tax=Sporothrix brasiliensis 5110 TaxID=1398154 RepID=A0A0C2FJE2_9PEZI|nr:uncharacterized protein SPBR_01322 [Sporothrix brasiliensis 5110]KIH91138.1 hypothetical protein SPBR_01322 [Sporothrix brasiliensis 5110]